MRSAALAVALAAVPAGAANGEGGLPYPGDLGQAIAAVVIFAVLLLLLGRYAWKPILRQLAQREKMVHDAIARAEKREQKSQELMAHYQARLDAAESEAKQLIEQSRADAESTRNEILDTARDQAEQIIRESRESLQQAKRKALEDLYDSTAQLAADIAGRVIRRELSPDEHARLVSQSLDEIRRQLRPPEGQPGGAPAENAKPQPPEPQDT